MSRRRARAWAVIAALTATSASAQTPPTDPVPPQAPPSGAGAAAPVAEPEAATETESAAATESEAATAPAAESAAVPAAESETEPAAASETVSETVTEPETASESVSESVPAAAEVVPVSVYETGFTLGAGIAVGILNLPKLGAAPSLWGRLALADGWAFELGVDWWLANEAELDIGERDLVLHPIYIIPFPPGGSRLRFEGFEVAAAVCPHRIRLVPGELALCAGVRGGMLRVEAEGFTDTEEHTRALFALTAFARWHYRLAGPVGVSYSAALFVPFLRDRYGYVDSVGIERTEFEPAPVGGRLDLALTYTF